MSTPRFTRACRALLIGVASIISSHAFSARPNIIIMMVDDLGWNHIGVGNATIGTHDAKYVTPNLVKLAASGTSFTHAYAQPNCAPTRAAMLSGQYSARVHNDVYVVDNLNRFGKNGVRKNDASFRGPSQSEDVAPEAVTIAEALRANGYATAHIGKFHVGGHRGDSTLPENVGFDINLGGFRQGHQPVCFASEQGGTWKFKGVGRGDFDRFAPPYDASYIERRGLAESLVGSPKHISDALGDALEETIDHLAAADRPFYLQFHTYAVHGPVRARPDLRARAAARSKSKPDYVGFISGVDENVGRMLSCLDDPNGDGDTSDSISQNTIVMFTSDNGGTHASNAPLKGHKGMLTEGGIRVPLIASCPGVIPEGKTTDRLIHSVDYYPTLLDLIEAQNRPSPEVHALDGVSFAGTLLGQSDDPRSEPVGFLFPGYLDNRATPSVVMIDDLDGRVFKLIYDYEKNGYELYCLSDDQAEQNECSETEAWAANRLSRAMREWLSKEENTWKPKYPLRKPSGEPAGPPPLFGATASASFD
ncbi:MAG: sulfatase-like hydrolase/transferase [Planctomycetota bacterium]